MADILGIANHHEADCFFLSFITKQKIILKHTKERETLSDSLINFNWWDKICWPIELKLFIFLRNKNKWKIPMCVSGSMCLL